MSESPERSVQRECRCRHCGLGGLPPEVTEQEALLLSAGDLEIRCPQCGAILKIRSGGLELLAGLGVLAQRRAASWSELVRQALEQTLGRELEQRRNDE